MSMVCVILCPASTQEGQSTAMGSPLSPAVNEQAQPRRINTPSYDPFHHMNPQESGTNEDNDKVNVRRAMTPDCEARNVSQHDGAFREEKAKLDCIRTAEQVTNDEETPVRRKSTPSYSPCHRKRRGSAESADLPSSGKHKISREKARSQSPGNRKLSVEKGDTSRPGSRKSSAEKTDPPSSCHYKRGGKKEDADAEKLPSSSGNGMRENDKVEPRRSKTPSCEVRTPSRGRQKSIEEQANRLSRESLQMKL
ncbi:hypothetical protein GCK32_005394 [Trichostrongylus colubriformis]|uniref:Uncharacterized protein n=1 Tax=Trichostrongylus colubriformis TaxID=6319 RepID=A0AAN8G574_TRICO